ncbi:MAG: hypothetical protein V2I54_11275 [Bacteroidales bacterium]|jgi:hypothetical protein|nr:hypothetical protein [Bacteroidales bacterium]
MKTYFPYYFKKIGIILVTVSIVFSFLSGLHTFTEGFEEGYNSTKNNEEQKIEFKADPFTAKTRENLRLIGLTLSFSGLIVYMFSSEKIEDEFIQNLRYKSLTKSLIITWIIYGLVYILKNNFNPERIELHWHTDGLYVLQFQLFMYVIIYNYYKKWKFD